MSKSILIVDDNAGIRKAVRLGFEKQNSFQICGEAIDGRDAIEKAKELKPDLIILDFSMPLMNGLEAARVLTVLMPAVPLILYTMHVGNIAESDARAAGFRAVVCKSQGLELLVTQVQTLLNISSASRSQAQGI